jgi:hypothetical protein
VLVRLAKLPAVFGAKNSRWLLAQPLASHEFFSNGATQDLVALKRRVGSREKAVKVL